MDVESALSGKSVLALWATSTPIDHEASTKAASLNCPGGRLLRFVFSIERGRSASVLSRGWPTRPSRTQCCPEQWASAGPMEPAWIGKFVFDCKCEFSKSGWSELWMIGMSLNHVRSHPGCNLKSKYLLSLLQSQGLSNHTRLVIETMTDANLRPQDLSKSHGAKI